MIITITKAAANHINRILTKHPAGSFFRLSVKETGCSGYMYQPEIVQAPKENDVAVVCSELKIYVDPDCVPLIQSTVMDFVQKPMGQSQLSFNNPNAEGLCGCGESFTLKSK